MPPYDSTVPKFLKETYGTICVLDNHSKFFIFVYFFVYRFYVVDKVYKTFRNIFQS